MRPRIGLIGLGKISNSHSEGYGRAADRCTIAAVCDADADRAAQSASAFNGARAFTDASELLSSGLIDAVDVMLPHSMHEPVASEAINHGLNVLIEKPVTTTVAAYDRLSELADEHGVMLAVAENTRYVSAYTAARDVLARGDLGEIQYVRTLIVGDETDRLRRTDNWKGRRDGTVGGVILDAGAHSFFLLSWFFGAVQDLTATSWQRVRESEVEDVAVVAGQLASGAQFTTEYSFTSRIPWSERAEIYGSDGSLVIDQLADPVVKLYRDKRDFEGKPIAGVAYNPSGWKPDSIAAEVVDFVDALCEGRRTVVDSRDVRNALCAIEASYQSVAEGRLIGLPRSDLSVDPSTAPRVRESISDA